MGYQTARRVAPLLFLALAACAHDAADMQVYLPGVARTNALYHGVAVGEVTGTTNRASLFTGASFKEALRRTLDGAAMLAPAGAAARYRVDAAFDFDPSGNTAGDYRVDAAITYRLFDLATGAKVMETERRSTESAHAEAGQTAQFILFGTLGSPATRAFSPEERWDHAYDAAARENLRDAVDALAAWGRARPAAQ